MENLYEMLPFCWNNTVELTLSIENSQQVLFFFDNNALPIMEHLNITNEEIPVRLSSHSNTSISSDQLNKTHLYGIVGYTRLKSLILRFFSIIDFNALLDSLKMPLLEKLILVDFYDNSKLYATFYLLIKYCFCFSIRSSS